MRLTAFALLISGLLAVNATGEIPIQNADGAVLQNPRIERFDGEIFYISHDGGLAKIPWAKMPESYRQKYSFDPKHAAEVKSQIAKSAQDHAIAEDEAARVSHLEQRFICGKIISRDASGFILLTDGYSAMSLTNPTYYFCGKGTEYHVALEPLSQDWTVDYHPAFLARVDGVWKFTNASGKEMEPIHLTHLEKLPAGFMQVPEGGGLIQRNGIPYAVPAEPDRPTRKR